MGKEAPFHGLGLIGRGNELVGAGVDIRDCGILCSGGGDGMSL
jgi:hypothetical protein